MRNSQTALLDEAHAYQQEHAVADWTPEEQIEERLVEAFEILRRLGGTIGPKAFGSNWPNILREFSDLVDPQAFTQAQDEFWKGRTRPGKLDISRMEEALGWVPQYLGDDPKMADAVNLWAFSLAWGRNISAILRDRNKRAAPIAREMEQEINARLKARRRQLAVEPANWANKRYWQSDGSAEARERILANAVNRLEREFVKLGIQQSRVIVKPSQAEPLKVMDQNELNRKRWHGIALIRVKLERIGVFVRPGVSVAYRAMKNRGK